MAVFQKANLGNIAYVATTVGSIYANAASTTTFVRGLTLHNTNTTAETVAVYNVPNAAGALGTAGNGNKFLALSLAANETVFLSVPYSIVMTGTNDSIQSSTTTASKVTVMVHGDKYV